VVAAYYANPDLAGAPQSSRCETSIANDWGAGGPSGTGVGTDLFSARWTGTLALAAPESLTFVLTGDDGVRLWVDGALALDGWVEQGPTSYQTTLVLPAGEHSLVVEYFEQWGGATVRLGWFPAGPS
jgi:hypothetical protein